MSVLKLHSSAYKGTSQFNKYSKISTQLITCT